MPYLPHIYPIGATFFITFRLADSLPQNIIKELKLEFEREELKILNSTKGSSVKEMLIYDLRKNIFGKYDNQLDVQPYGACHLIDATAARLLWDKIFQYHGLYYMIKALSIMPNHVHMLMDTSIQVSPETDIDERSSGYVDVDKWMQLIKGGSSFLINKHLNRSGTLWGKESYDHYVRFNNPGEFERIKDYIVQNPRKAGLGDRFFKEPYLFSE